MKNKNTVKKLIACALIMTIISCAFVGCKKNIDDTTAPSEETTTEPISEVITDENGATHVVEYETDPSGAVLKDAEGKKVVKPTTAPETQPPATDAQTQAPADKPVNKPVNKPTQPNKPAPPVTEAPTNPPAPPATEAPTSPPPASFAMTPDEIIAYANGICVGRGLIYDETMTKTNSGWNVPSVIRKENSGDYIKECINNSINSSYKNSQLQCYKVFVEDLGDQYKIYFFK